MSALVPHRLGAVVVGALLAVGCSGQHAKTPPPPFQSEILLTADARENFDLGITASSFRLHDVRDLWVRVKVPSMPKVATLSLTFVNPLGELFYEDNTLFTTDASVQMSDDIIMHHPVPTLPATPLKGGFALDRIVPIAGSIFHRVPIRDGAWGVTASVEGVPGKLTTTVLFSALR
jgi:hypothetical protein